MSDKYTIVMDNSLIDVGLLLLQDNSLPRVVRNVNNCIPFVGMLDQKPVSVCLVEERDGCHDIAGMAVTPQEQGKGYGQQLLRHVMDYLQKNGGRYLEVGCGNAQLQAYILFQKAGFRVVDVWPDHYLSDSKAAAVENGILNRDMIRLRVDLKELGDAAGAAK